MLAVPSSGRLLSRWLPWTHLPAAAVSRCLHLGSRKMGPPAAAATNTAAGGDTVVPPAAPPGFKIRAGNPLTDIEQILSLMPRLATFDIPAWRAPTELWVGDADTLKKWAREADTADGNAATGKLVVLVAEATRDPSSSDDCPDESCTAPLLGLAAITMQPEFLSGAPGAHLETILVAEGSEGAGIGRALLARAEATALARGAETMTLHVFASNIRARRLYAGSGYDEELVRCIKPLG